MSGATLRVRDVLVRAARTLLDRQRDDGSLPPGHNGVYGDPETPVRTTAHALVLLSRLLRMGEGARTRREPHEPQERPEARPADAEAGPEDAGARPADAGAPPADTGAWRRGAERALAYLLSAEAAPARATFACRDAPGKDRCNGVMGQAYAIEALVEAAEALRSEAALARAEELFHLHPWCEATRVWHRVEPDGRVLAPDRTFNHQLWFAAAAAMLTRVPEARERARAFLEHAVPAARLYPDGVLEHLTPMAPLTAYARLGPRALAREARARLRARRAARALYPKSVAYLPFNLYALALLKGPFPDSPVWGGATLRRMLRAGELPEVVAEQARNDYSQARELAGIKMAYVLQTFGGDRAAASARLSEQLARSWTLLPDRIEPRDSVDADAARARLYELSRVDPDLELELRAETPVA